MRALGLAVLVVLAPVLAVAAPRVARADLESDAPPGACATAAVDHGTPRVRACLVVDGTVRAGDTVRVGARLRMPPDWHVYWSNPGQGALATEVSFTADGATASRAEMPAPVRIVRGDGIITLYAYEDEVTFASTVHVADGATRATVHGVVDFLVCDVDCIPGRVELSREVPLGDATQPSRDAEVREALDAAAARTPRALDALGWTVLPHFAPERVATASTFELTLHVDANGPLAAPVEGVASAYFPELTRSVEWTATRVEPTTDGADVLVRGTTGPDDPGGDQDAAGVLALRAADGTPRFARFAFRLPRAAGGAAMAAAAPAAEPAPPGPAIVAPDVSLGAALLLALLGGLILNLMPCVLPVLLVKVASFTRVAGESRRTRALHVVAYVAGIEAAMLGLAAVVVGLRAGGLAVGWGFQFQEPAFLAGASTLLVVLALGLFGLYTLVPPLASEASARVESMRAGLGRSAGEGVLAVLLATPCSAPLLGTAVGFALAGSATRIALVFAAIGLGLAVPFALVALVPGARKLVPKPGAWMVVLERVLGFALLATVVWLAWVLGEIAGAEAMARLLGFLVAAAFATWVVASTRALGRVGRTIGLVGPLVLLPVIGVHVLQFPAVAAPPGASRSDAWSEDAVTRALADGHPVLVDFTADWCITCKVNERTVLASADVRRAIRDSHAVVLRADWTRRDEPIRLVLAAHGKAGVPMYLVYRPSQPQAPEVLPELITPGIVVDALRRATQGS